MAESIGRNRQIVNFEYWRTRCAAEKTQLALDAHKDVYDADKLFAAAEQFDAARAAYERSWEAWAKIFAEHPALMDNAEAQDLIESIERYRDLLGQLDEKFPVDFKLVPLLERHQEGRELLQQVKLLSDTPGGSPTPPTEPKPTEPKPAEPAATDPKPPEDKPAEPKP